VYFLRRYVFLVERGQVRRPDPLTMKKTTVFLVFPLLSLLRRYVFLVERGRVQRPDPLTMKKTTVSLWYVHYILYPYF